MNDDYLLKYCKAIVLCNSNIVYALLYVATYKRPIGHLLVIINKQINKLKCIDPITHLLVSAMSGVQISVGFTYITDRLSNSVAFHDSRMSSQI